MLFQLFQMKCKKLAWGNNILMNQMWQKLSKEPQVPLGWLTGNDHFEELEDIKDPMEEQNDTMEEHNDVQENDDVYVENDEFRIYEIVD